MKRFAGGLVLWLLACAAAQAADDPFPGSDISDSPVVRVGEGAISGREWGWTKRRFAREHNRDPFKLTNEEKETLLLKAIDDEILFQEAVRQGVHREEAIRRVIVNDYLSQKTIMKLDPKSYPEKELRAYYEEHPDEFMKRGAVRASSLLLKDTSPEAVEAVRKNPEKADGWMNAGWIEEGGEDYSNLFEEGITQIFGLKEGEVSGVIYARGRMGHLFRIDEKRAGRRLSFEEAKPHIRHALTLQKKAAAERELLASLGVSADGEDREEALLAAAVAEGRHRWHLHRQRIIESFASANGGREVLLEKLRPQVTVERVVERI